MASKKTKLQPVRGTQDILPDENRLHRHVENMALQIAELYGFGEISTPLFEFTEVFSRTLGDTSDIVTKEMYTFEDRGGDRLTLRPEGTRVFAPVQRPCTESATQIFLPGPNVPI